MSSTPEYITIRRIPNKPLMESFIEVWLGKRAGDDLCNYLLKHLPQAVPDFAEDFEDMHWTGLMTLSLVAQKDFIPIYHLIMQACDELESLKPYKAELKAALEADPRFKQAA